ncbi:ABC transporter permease [Parapedobacter tibetensis]|uniref:ABC transporter permease n=1 Tax=Parapedobacter tibetensis TaxID=2972951 RepID=UPI00214D412E|nr:ABC transporter permease [Parapedobacter tibetensis]
MNRLGDIIIREWKRIVALPVFYIVLLIVPSILFFFYALIYQKQDAKELPFAIWDEDNSAISRQLIYLLEQGETLKITEHVNNEADLKRWIQNGEIMGAIHFPVNMQNDIYSKRVANVTLYTNAASLVPAKLIYKAVAEVVIMGSAGVTLQKLQKEGIPSSSAMAIANPVNLISYQLYNADYNYQKYLVPGLITVGIQMIIIISCMLALNYEWKTNSMDELYQLSNGSASLVILGKTIAHLVVAWFNFVLIAFVIFPYFGIGVAAATGKFFILYSLLTLACIGVGMFISSLFKDVMLAGDTALFYTSPAFVFSGFTFPRWAMPWYDQYYATIMPYTSFLDAFFKAYYMNLPLHYSENEIGKLVLFCIVLFPTAIILFSKQFKTASQVSERE